MVSRSKRSVAAVVLIAAACLGVGAVVGVVAARAGAPVELAAPPAASTIGATPRPFDDARSVSLTLQQIPGLSLSTSRNGVVTASSCVPGGLLRSGEVGWAVAGVGLLALHTDVPLYRDLHPGDTGPDVTGLTAELHRLDARVPAAGTLTAAHVAAVNALLALGQSPPTDASVVARDRIVWLPESSVHIASCLAVLGAEVSGALAATAPTVTAATLAQPPVGLVPGKRVLVVDGTVFPVTTDPPAVADPADVAKLLATSAGAAAAATAGSSTPVPLLASYALATPVEAATVPAGAVIGSSALTCVLDASGAAHRVRVVDSQLGRSIVQFTDQPTPTAVMVAPPSTASCS